MDEDILTELSQDEGDGLLDAVVEEDDADEDILDEDIPRELSSDESGGLRVEQDDEAGELLVGEDEKGGGLPDVEGNKWGELHELWLFVAPLGRFWRGFGARELPTVASDDNVGACVIP